MNQLSLAVTLPLPLHVEQGPLYVHLVLYKSCFLIKKSVNVADSHAARTVSAN